MCVCVCVYVYLCHISDIFLEACHFIAEWFLRVFLDGTQCIVIARMCVLFTQLLTATFRFKICPFSKPSLCLPYLYAVNFTGKKLTVFPSDNTANSTFTNSFFSPKIKCNHDCSALTYYFGS